MKYMLIHCIDETAEHSTDGIPTFDSWLGTIEVRPIQGARCGSPEEAG